jgi:hypothetical protein
MNSNTKLDRAAILAQIDSNVRKGPYSKEDAARDRTLLDLANSLDPQRAAVEQQWMRARWSKAASSAGVFRPAFDETEAGQNFRAYLRGGNEARDMSVGMSTAGGALGTGGI